MPHQATESANNVLDSLHRRFVDETYGGNGLFFESIFKTRKQLANLLIGDQSEELLAKSRIVHEGIYDWLEALAKLAHAYAGRLVAIIGADPQLCSSENPAQWIRLWLEERLQKHLRQGELKLEKRTRQDWLKRVEAAWESVPEKKRRRALDLARTAWESLPEETRSIRTFEEHFLSSSSSDNAHAKSSRVESWLRRVVDGLPDFDRSSTGYEEPWLAPPWCNEEIWIKIRLKKHGACPDRLTREQTSRLIHRFENMFAARLDYVLGVEEDEARIALAQQPPAEHSARRDLVIQPVPLPTEAKVTLETTPIPQMKVWRGTDRSFADKILKQFADGDLHAKSAMDALRQASKRYVRKNGKQFNHRSLWQNIQNRKTEGK